jgi:hypothetical protein
VNAETVTAEDGTFAFTLDPTVWTVSATASGFDERSVTGDVDSFVASAPKLKLAKLAARTRMSGSSVVLVMTSNAIDEALRRGTEIAEAMRRGTEEAPPAYYTVGAVDFTTPFLRVVQIATESKLKYVSFTRASVTPAMIRPVIEVHADGMALSAGVTINPEHVVVAKGPGPDAAILQPISLRPTVHTYQNGFGNKTEAHGFIATFPLDVLHEGFEFRLLSNGSAFGPKESVHPITAEALQTIK